MSKTEKGLVTYLHQVNGPVNGMYVSRMSTAYVSFEHDIEDGWYRMKHPDGTSDTWNNASDAVKFARSKGWRVEWVGDDWYKPREIDFDA